MQRNFFADNIEELPNNRIDYAMFRNSASSLKDFYLFGPPQATQSANNFYYQSEDHFCHANDVKRSIFINEFIPFSFKEASWSQHKWHNYKSEMQRINFI